MYSVKVGDIFDVTHGIIIHGCNAQGVMGSGIAKTVKARFPEAFKLYRQEFEKAITSQMFIELGSVVMYQHSNELVIANAITQQTYGPPGKKYVSYKAIKRAFEFTFAHAEKLQLPVHFPKLGAELGGGDWSIIGDIIRATMLQFPEVKATFWIYE